jgi:hypothetical protein
LAHILQVVVNSKTEHITLKTKAMKRSKILPTLLSLATIGLSSAVLQAQEAPPSRADGMEISEEIRQLVANFREQRAALMGQFREARLAHRDAMVELIEELKNHPEGSDEWEDAKAAIVAKRAEFRETYGESIRNAREALRDLRRQFRDQIREQLPPEGEG